MKALLFFACLFSSGSAIAQQVVDPPILDLTPEWLEKNINPQVLDSLVDPDSAKIEWKYTTTLLQSTDKIPDASGKMVKTKVRYALTCGTVNAKNRMGGYSGKSFILVAQWPTRLWMHIEEDGGSACADYVRKGVIMPRT